MRLSTSQLIAYVQSRIIDEESRRVDGDPNDPILRQAEMGGLVEYFNGKWYTRGKMIPGEIRILRSNDGKTMRDVRYEEE